MELDIKYQANKVMYLLADDKKDIEFGKSWTWILNAFKTRLNSLSRGSAILNIEETERKKKEYLMNQLLLNKPR